jgi:diphosphomevalonate decarboxylase
VSEALKSTAVAHPNVALVKYWGKRDELRILPHQSSVSLAVAPLEVRTTVEFQADSELVQVQGRLATQLERNRVLTVLKHLQASLPRPLGRAKVFSRSNFPDAAGLASSAAAFASLAVAARAAAGLLFDARASSILGRIGSGSASRSIQGGASLWRRGTSPDGSDSFAEQVFPETHWPELRLVAAVIDPKRKQVSSRDGMRRSAQTSPYFAAWTADAEAEAIRAVDRLRSRDLAGLGELAERNAWRMHAVALSSDPPLCYLQPATLQLLLQLPDERSRGTSVWFTLDAGPNPFLLTDERHVDRVEAIARECGAAEVFRCQVGGDARLLDEHLF